MSPKPAPRLEVFIVFAYRFRLDPEPSVYVHRTFEQANAARTDWQRGGRMVEIIPSLTNVREI